MTTQIVSFSDTTIRKCAANSSITQLRDPRYSLRFRFSKDRQSGSWHLYHCLRGKETWRKVGTWPRLKTKDVISQLPTLELSLAINAESRTLTDTFSTVGELLTWYLDRSRTDRNLGDARRITIRWAIQRHLMPRIGDLALDDVNHSELDESLFWPMQQQYSNSTVRSVWNVFKQATKRAHRLKHIRQNPLAAFQFTDFISAAIDAKPTELKSDQLPLVLTACQRADFSHRMLVTMMLLHGTRIGETRKAKWEHINLSSGEWNIPATDTKTRQAHDLPLTSTAVHVLNDYRHWQTKNGYTGVYLFPNDARKGPISSNIANDYIKNVSLGEWRSHSLRKAARTVWMDLGIDYMVAELLLNHAMSKLNQAYIHTYAKDQKRLALEVYHLWIDKKVGSVFG